MSALYGHTFTLYPFLTWETDAKEVNLPTVTWVPVSSTQWAPTLLQLSGTSY